MILVSTMRGSNVVCSAIHVRTITLLPEPVSLQSGTARLENSYRMPLPDTMRVCHRESAMNPERPTNVHSKNDYDLVLSKPEKHSHERRLMGLYCLKSPLQDSSRRVRITSGSSWSF